MNRRDFVKLAAIAAVGASFGAQAAVPRQYMQTRFGRIAYLERGKGPQAALFLHGFPLSSYQWRDAIELLSPYRRCLAPDFLALGMTEVAPGQGVGPDEQVEMLLTFLDQQGIAQADVVASDSGGAVAQLLLARHPQRVRSLLLANCDCEADCPPEPMKEVIALSHKGTWVDAWLVPWVADKNKARAPDAFGGACYEFPSSPSDAAIDHYLGPLVSTPQRKALAQAYAIALDRNVLAGTQQALRASTAPVRIVWGMADTIFKPTDADYLDRSFGNSRGVRRLATSKLFWPEERPDVIAEEARTLWGV